MRIAPVHSRLPTKRRRRARPRRPARWRGPIRVPAPARDPHRSARSQFSPRRKPARRFACCGASRRCCAISAERNSCQPAATIPNSLSSGTAPDRDAANVGVVVGHRVADRALERIDRVREHGGNAPARLGIFGERAMPNSRISSMTSLRSAAAVASELAADQVVCLNAGRAFVDRRDARIAQLLRHPGLLDESHAAVNLDRERGEVDGILGAPTLDDGNHQVGECLVAAALGLVRMQSGGIQSDGDDAGERTHRFGLRFDAASACGARPDDARSERARALRAALGPLDALLRDTSSAL